MRDNLDEAGRDAVAKHVLDARSPARWRGQRLKATINELAFFRSSSLFSSRGFLLAESPTGAAPRQCRASSRIQAANRTGSDLIPRRKFE
jgi:hypothetical protein